MPDLDLIAKEFGLQVKDDTPNEEKERLIRELVAQKTGELATYLTDNPDSKKMRRKKNMRDCSIIRIKKKDKYEYYLMAAEGQQLGEGAFGRVKLALRLFPPDENLGLYTVKREWANTEAQQRETRILQHLKLMEGEKMERVSSTTKGKARGITGEVHKFYTVTPYFGKDLKKTLGERSFSAEDKLDMAIKIALEVNKLHTKNRCAHGDIKLDNILLNKSNEIHLIDFGYAKPIDSPLDKIEGTPGYIPGYVKVGSGGGFVYNYRVYPLWKKLGNYTSTDVFALKRTINQDNLSMDKALVKVENLWQTNRVLAEMLDTRDDERAVTRQETAAMLGANLILERLKLYSLSVLSDEDSKKIIALYESNASTAQIAETLDEMKIYFPRYRNRSCKNKNKAII